MNPKVEQEGKGSTAAAAASEAFSEIIIPVIPRLVGVGADRGVGRWISVDLGPNRFRSRSSLFAMILDARLTTLHRCPPTLKSPRFHPNAIAPVQRNL